MREARADPQCKPEFIELQSWPKAVPLVEVF
jgi:hypothetical protein